MWKIWKDNGLKQVQNILIFNQILNFESLQDSNSIELVSKLVCKSIKPSKSVLGRIQFKTNLNLHHLFSLTCFSPRAEIHQPNSLPMHYILRCKAGYWWPINQSSQARVSPSRSHWLLDPTCHLLPQIPPPLTWSSSSNWAAPRAFPRPSNSPTTIPVHPPQSWQNGDSAKTWQNGRTTNWYNV